MPSTYNLCLRKSKGSILDVVYRGWYGREAQSFTNRVLSQSHRWRSFEATGHDPNLIRHFLSSPLSQLDDLEITQCVTAVTIPKDLLTHLRHLTVKGAAVRWETNTSLASLRTLNLLHYSEMQLLSLSQLIAMVKTAPGLVSLALEVSKVDHSTPHDTAPLQFGYLTALSLRLPLHAMHALLACMRIAHCQTLNLITTPNPKAKGLDVLMPVVELPMLSILANKRDVSVTVHPQAVKISASPHSSTFLSNPSRLSIEIHTRKLPELLGWFNTVLATIHPAPLITAELTSSPVDPGDHPSWELDDLYGALSSVLLDDDLDHDSSTSISFPSHPSFPSLEEVLPLLLTACTVRSLHLFRPGHQLEKILAFLSEKTITKDGSTGWPLPRLKDLTLDDDHVNPKTILDMVQQRHGQPVAHVPGGRSGLPQRGEAHALERQTERREGWHRPASLSNLTVKTWRSLGSVEYKELEAIVGRDCVSWLGAEEEIDERDFNDYENWTGGYSD